MNSQCLLLMVATAGLALQAAAAGAAEPPATLGRLFMTPEWRAHLERQRQHNLQIQETRSLEGGSMRLDGVVMRSGGKSTVWINNRPQTESAGNTGVLVTPARQQPERAILSAGAPGAEETAELKVGESINRATREVGSGLADGEIRVHRPASRR